MKSIFRLRKALGAHKRGKKFDSFGGIVSGVEGISFTDREYFELLNDHDAMQKAFDAMRKGKKFRLSPNTRSEINSQRDISLSDQWFTINSIDCLGRVELCGDNHTILNNYPLSAISL